MWQIEFYRPSGWCRLGQCNTWERVQRVIGFLQRCGCVFRVVRAGGNDRR